MFKMNYNITHYKRISIFSAQTVYSSERLWRHPVQRDLSIELDVTSIDFRQIAAVPLYNFILLPAATFISRTVYNRIILLYIIVATRQRVKGCIYTTLLLEMCLFSLLLWNTLS